MTAPNRVQPLPLEQITRVVCQRVSRLSLVHVAQMKTTDRVFGRERQGGVEEAVLFAESQKGDLGACRPTDSSSVVGRGRTFPALTGAISVLGSI